VQSSERSQERRPTSPYAAIVEYIYAAEPIEPVAEVDATAERIVATLGFPR
jgi:hypothetical protein